MAWNILPAYSNKMTAHKTHFLQNHESNMSNIVRSRLSLNACEIPLNCWNWATAKCFYNYYILRSIYIRDSPIILYPNNVKITTTITFKNSIPYFVTLSWWWLRAQMTKYEIDKWIFMKLMKRKTKGTMEKLTIADMKTSDLM